MRIRVGYQIFETGSRGASVELQTHPDSSLRTLSVQIPEMLTFKFDGQFDDSRCDDVMSLIHKTHGKSIDLTEFATFD